jgi:uncharacterized delta-60 repeat protein
MESAMKKIFMMLAAVLILAVAGCGSSGSDSRPVSSSSAKAITGFSLNGCFGIINETNKTIAVSMPLGTDLKTLVATFTTTGVSVKVGSTVLTSGQTVIDFSTTNPVTYTVTAADASTQDYTVTVTVSLSTSGFLDTAGFGTAGTGGKVTTTIGSSDEGAHALGFQSDGKIVVAGSSFNSNTSKYDFALVRYNTDGSLDTGFGATGTNGKVTTSIGNGDDRAFALVIQSDDTILVAGKSSINSSSGTEINFALVRYTKDGIIDTTFGAAGTNGKVTTSIGGIDDEAYALGIQSDGKIVVAGSSQNGSYYYFALVRYNANGTLDANISTGFGATHTGIVTTAIGTDYDFATDLVILSDDTILVAGRSSYNSGGTVFNYALVKYTKDGIPDTTFGADHTGIVTTSIGSITTTTGIIDDQGHTLGVQSDGNIVVAGNSYDDSSIRYNFALVRYTKEGILDTTFGTSGIAITPIGSGNNFAYALGIQLSDDSILVAGSSFNSSNYDFALVKYTKKGSLDTTFGTGGIAITPIGSSDDYAYALGIQPTSDKKIVVAGTSYDDSSKKYNFALVRYWP